MKIYVVFLSDDCHSLGHYDLDALVEALDEEDAKHKAEALHPHYIAYDAEAIGETEEE